MGLPFSIYPSMNACERIRINFTADWVPNGYDAERMLSYDRRVHAITLPALTRAHPCASVVVGLFLSARITGRR